jgi:SAM-dependent methyltransferase
MKDNFSQQSDRYAKFRPRYPELLYDYLNSLVPRKENAWDCGSGNGQVAICLAKTFTQVFATDISQAQIDNALQAENIHYSVQPAEKTSFENNIFDLIVAAQAVHWFDFEKFYAEVKRTARKNALIVLLGYGRLQTSTEIDTLLDDFYFNQIGKYWDSERRYIDENYQTIPFPFEEIQAPKFTNTLQWDLEHLLGYLNTWSAVKHFTKHHNYNPVELLRKPLEQFWTQKQILEVSFPLLLRIGKIHSV